MNWKMRTEPDSLISSCLDVLPDKYRLSMLSGPLKHITDSSTSSGGVLRCCLSNLSLSSTFGSLFTQPEIHPPRSMEVVGVDCPRDERDRPVAERSCSQFWKQPLCIHQ